MPFEVDIHYVILPKSERKNVLLSSDKNFMISYSAVQYS